MALVDSKPDTSPHDRRNAPTTESSLTTTHAPWQTLVHTRVCVHISTINNNVGGENVPICAENKSEECLNRG